MNRKTEGIVVIVIAVLAFALMFMFLGLDTPIFLIILFLVVLGVGISLLIDGNKAAGAAKPSRTENEIVDSHTLHDEMNRDLKRDGKSSVQAINNACGMSTGNLARKDKSWSSVPDFFAKLVKKNK